MPDTRPTVAVIRKTYLARSETWIHTELRAGKRYARIVLTTRTENLDRFPWPEVYQPADLPRLTPAWWADRLGQRLFGRLPYLAGIVRRRRVALLHAHFGYDAVWALPIAQATGRPLVTTFHGGDMYEPDVVEQFAAAYRKLFSLGRRFIVLGENMRARIIHLGCPPEKVCILHLAVDPDEWPLTPRPPIQDAIQLLFCARLTEVKGLRYVLEAMKLLKERNVPAVLTVIGYVGETDVAEMNHPAYVRDLGIEERVRFLGYQPPERFREELQRAHVFLQPSVTTASGIIEGAHPTTLVEAQSSGCPVIATRHSDIPEAVRDGHTGWLVDERHPEQIADRVQWFREHPEALHAFAAQARRHVEERHNLRTEAARLEALYDEVLSEPAAGRTPD